MYPRHGRGRRADAGPVPAGLKRVVELTWERGDPSVETSHLGPRSWLNLKLRSAARRLSPANPLRRAGARAWDSLLRLTGSHVTLPVQGYPIRLAAGLRSFNVDYESDALRSFLRLVGPGDLVWDVGANIGVYTLLAGLHTGPGGKVVAWEPNPETYRRLRAHLRANGLEGRCTALQAAANDGADPRACFVLGIGTDSNTDRLAGDRRTAPGKVVEVEAASLDGWQRRLGCTPSH